MSIKINGNSRQDRNTLQMATTHRLNQEIKFLHIKKSKLNEQLYETHLKCANLWPGTWPSIQDIIDNNLQQEMETCYDALNSKLDRLQEKRKKTAPHTPHGRRQQTYPRTVNLTNIQFTKEEQAILNLGLQYSLHKSCASSWTTLALETERAIKLLDSKIQNSFRILAAKQLKQLYNTNHINTIHKRQLYVLKQIKQKITQGNAQIACADKGKTTVFIYTQDYTAKVHAFLSENNFRTLTKNPTHEYHKTIHKTLLKCDKIIDKKLVKYLTQKNPSPPTLNARLKLHKPNTPIRPVVNNRPAPAYKAAKN